MVSLGGPISIAILTPGLLISSHVCGLAKPFLVMTVKEWIRMGVEKSMTRARSGVGLTAKAISTLSPCRSRIWLPQEDSTTSTFALSLLAISFAMSTQAPDHLPVGRSL